MKKLTVADILQLDILKNVTICAGAAGLSHFVTGITTAEDPDLIRWLTGGEILLTSLYGAVTGPLSFKEYIDTLASAVWLVVYMPGFFSLFSEIVVVDF